MTAGLFDCITTPKQGNVLPDGVRFCADNGKFGKGWPGEQAWFRWLQTLPTELCDFAVAPDVPFDALATLDESLPWCPRIRELGIRAAVVAQNGFEDISVIPWDEFDVLFLGGTMECVPCGYVRPVGDFTTKHCPTCTRRLIEWKLGGAAYRLTREAHDHGLAVHMGRVNSEKRFLYAAFIGCDSADGTYLTRGPDINLPKLTRWIEREPDQLGGAA
jgi:hypothetical protein